jgi:hypothetical protein
MYTSLTLFALSGIMAATPTPSWQKDYDSARRVGKSEGKPLAVFIGSGPKGYEKIADDGKLDRQAQTTLARKYVCLYVDIKREAGERLARAFRLDSGIVISDRTGSIQAFRHEGSLPNRDLNRYLERFSDPDLEVRTTTTHTTERLSYYPPAESVTPNYGYYGRGRSC